ncbi:MAG: cobalt ECF transporter T component CbiQ [Anaerolineae bacterium]
MKSQGIDTYAHLDSPLHRWENRYKIAGLFILAFAFAYVKDMRLLPFMLLITAGLYAASKLPLPFLFTRLKIPGFILLGIVISLPFLAGTTEIFSIGPVSIQLEGVLSAVLIAVRFVCIITLSLLIFATDSIINTIKGLTGLKLPPIMADMLLLTYRYLFEMGHSLRTTQTAVRLRGFQNDRLSRGKLETLAALLGNLIVRSYEQSERVYHAMILRGYGATVVTPDMFHATGRDRLFFAIVLLIAIAFVAAQLLLGGL